MLPGHENIGQSTAIDWHAKLVTEDQTYELLT